VSFDRFVSQRQLIANSWSNVETELHRHHDPIPNLVETVRGYAEHALTARLRQLMAVSEDYPDVPASQRFLDLQRELVTTENRLQASR
jgi:LemA protein